MENRFLKGIHSTVIGMVLIAHISKEIAMEICKEFSFKYDEVEECRRFYDEETDTFYEEDYNCDYEREIIGNPMEINTENGKIKVYVFGGSWVWAEVEE